MQPVKSQTATYLLTFGWLCVACPPWWNPPLVEFDTISVTAVHEATTSGSNVSDPAATGATLSGNVTEGESGGLTSGALGGLTTGGESGGLSTGGESAGESSGASSSGQLGKCGDGQLDPAEVCDNGEDSNSCDADCTLAECGDGYLNAKAGEVCDDGNVSPGDTCSSACQDTSIAAFDAGDYVTCVAFASGKLRCWGAGFGGQLGNGDVEGLGDSLKELPVADIAVGGSVNEVIVGASSVCALIELGNIKCWGYGAYGSLGYGNTDNILTPPMGAVKVGAVVKAIDAGGFGHVCTRAEDGLVRCWGSNVFGELARGDTENVGDEPGEMPPAAIPGLSNIVKLSAGGGTHTCAVRDDDTLRCWGTNDFGQLGLGNTVAYGNKPGETAPPKVNLKGAVKSVAVGGGHTCALLSDDSVRCWGENSYGQLGYGHKTGLGDNPNEIESLSAVNIVKDGEKVIQIVAGWDHTCALLDTGSVRCWGRNTFGQLGRKHKDNIGDDLSEMPPEDTGLGGNVKRLSASGEYTCALLDNNSLRCWGRNEYGQLGLGDTKNVGDDEFPSEVSVVPF